MKLPEKLTQFLYKHFLIVAAAAAKPQAFEGEQQRQEYKR